MMLAAIPIAFTPGAQELFRSWDLRPGEAAYPVLVARAKAFTASDTFGSYPTDAPYADSWLGQIDLSDTPSARMNEVTDCLYRGRLVKALEVVLLDWPRDVTLLWDHLSRRYWVTTGGLSSGDQPTESCFDVDLIAESGICDTTIDSEDLQAGFPDRTNDDGFHEPTPSTAFDVDEAAFNSWWFDNDESCSCQQRDRWIDRFDTAAAAANELVSGSGAACIQCTGDWEVLVYEQHNGDRCDGILITSRRAAWPVDLQLSTPHIDNDDLETEFTHLNPLLLAEAVVDAANQLVRDASDCDLDPFCWRSGQ